MQTPTYRSSLIVLWLLIVTGCLDQDQSHDPSRTTFSQMRSSLEIGESPSASCASEQGIEAEGAALVLNQPHLLSDLFSMGRLLNGLTESNDESHSVSLIATMLESYREHIQVNSDSELLVPMDIRGGEADMDARDVIRDMQPVGVFNRIDLAALDGSDCGEYRIVYAKQMSGTSLPDGRFLMIFEARYPNPSPDLGRAGCAPMARFWQSLGQMGLEDAVVAMSTLFFDGMELEGVPHPRIIAPEHFQMPFGQVRTNNFIAFRKWQLREFRLAHNQAQQLVFVADTVKDVPLAELYSDTAVPKPVSAGETLEGLRVAFQNDFIESQLSHLLQPERRGAQEPNQLITGFSVAFDPKFYDFQSDSQGLSDDPETHARGQSLVERIAAALPEGSNLTGAHVLNRAGALTCGGCHRFSAGREIAPNVVWPSDGGFVHVSESGSLSPALKDVFLPERKRILEALLCEFPELPQDASEDDEPPEEDEPTRDTIESESEPETIVPTPLDSPEIGNVYLPPEPLPTWHYVSFRTAFANVPAVFAMASYGGGTSCDARVRHVTRHGFEVSCVTPFGAERVFEGGHLSYFAAPIGLNEVGEGQLEVNCLPVHQIQSGLRDQKNAISSWQPISFQRDFETRPIVLTEIQSTYTEGHSEGSGGDHVALISPAVRSVSRAGLEWAIDFHEQPIAPAFDYELVCYAAFGQQSFDLFIDDTSYACEAKLINDVRDRKGLFGLNDRIADDFMPLRVGVTLAEVLLQGLGSDSFQGGQDIRRKITRPLNERGDVFISRHANAVTIGSLNSRYESDGGWLGLTLRGGIGRFFVDEDQYWDSERSHGNETASVLVCTQD